MSEVSDDKQEDQCLETSVSQLDSSSDKNLDAARNCVALSDGEVSPQVQIDYFCESSSHNFVQCVESFVTTHRTWEGTDKEATDWLKLI